MSVTVSSVYRCHRCGAEAPGSGPEVTDRKQGRWRGPFPPDGWMQAAYPDRAVTEARVDLCAACANVVRDALRPLDPRDAEDGDR